MSEDTFVCAREGCDVVADRKTHNQKYCTDECCRLATNKRIMEKYYERQAQRKGTARYCKRCDITKLSRYNDSSICNGCKSEGQVAANNSVIAMLTNASLAS